MSKTNEGIGDMIIDYIISANLLQVVDGVVVWSANTAEQLSTLINYPEYKDMLCQECGSLPNEAGECPTCL